MAFGQTEVYVLDSDTLRRLGTEDPLLCAQIYRNIAVHLSQRLRAAVMAWRSGTK